MREHNRMKLMVTIVDKGKGAKAVELYTKGGLRLHYGTPGRGTVNSELMDYFGLGQIDKDVILTLVPEVAVSAVLKVAGERFQLRTPGKGILFVMPLSGLSALVAKKVNEDVCWMGQDKEGAMPGTESKNDLIVVMVNSGDNDVVMEAARSAGAQGGTILHGRRMGDTQQEGDPTVYPEKDIVTILVSRPLRQAVMEAINQRAGIKTDSHGVLFSIPVDNVLGLSLMRDDLHQSQS